MAYLKKNQLNQIMYVMVDATDFATIESAVTQSQMTAKIGNGSAVAKVFGVNHGGSVAMTSRTLTKVASLVHSGIWRQTLTASDCNFDYCTYRFSYPGSADQVMAFQMCTYTDADMMSRLLLVGSDTSDAMSAAKQVNSRVLLVQSLASDTWSLASDILSTVRTTMGASDLYSKVGKMASMAIVNQSVVSDMYSQVMLVASNVSDTWSLASDILSTVRTTMGASDLYSKVGKISSMAIVNKSLASDIYSLLASASNIASMVWSTDITNAKMASNIASQVWAHAIGARVDSRVVLVQSDASDAMSAAKQANSRVLLTQSLASDAASAAAQANSRILVVQSLVSDVDSALTSQYSDMRSLIVTTGVNLNTSVMSDIRSAITAGAAATVTRSDISDIISGVWAYNTASQTGAGTASSRLQVGAYTASDIASKVWNETYTAYKSTSASKFGAVIQYNLISLMSAVSDIYSALNVTATTSDIASAVWAQKWDVHSVASSFGSMLARIAESGVNITASNLSDLRSAITAGPAATVTDADISNIVSAVWYRTGGSDITSKIGKLASRITKEVANESRLLLVGSDTSDAMSAARQVNSRVLLNQSLASDAWSAAADAKSAARQANSRVFVVQSLVSDIDSAVTSQYSDLRSLVGTTMGASDIYSKVGKILSRVPGAGATQSKLGAVQSRLILIGSDTSDAMSAAKQVNSRVLLVQSLASDAHSAAAQANSRILVVQSLVSDVDSALTSQYSDLRSLIVTTGVNLNTSVMSDLRSAITLGPAAADPASIASAVWAHAIASDVYSKVGKTSSRVTMMDTSVLSDLRSFITAAESNINSHVSGITATVDKTAVASATWANAIGTRVDSRVLLIQSLASDAHSGTARTYSRALLIGSDASDTLSMVRQVNSRVTLVQSDASDAMSAAKQANSRILVVQSLASDIDSALTSQYSDIKSAITAGGLNQSAISDIASAVWAQKYGAHSVASSFGSLFEKMASGISDAYSDHILLKSSMSDLRSYVVSQFNDLSNVASDIRSAITAQDAAFTDATTITANTLKDRIRRLNWIMQNKIAIDDVSGDAVLYKDDNATAAYTVAGAITDTGVTTTRKRLE